jgi:glycine/D-amino acid oxidase-like deaminating enzyme
VRVCIVGGGLAGTLLAWRLATAMPRDQLDLVLGTRCRADATSASGGAVRAYEPDPGLRRLATASLVELLASPTLRRWARYRPVESVYLPADRPATAGQLTEIERDLPGSAELVPAATLAARGWAGVPADAVAVRERRAGYLAPASLRDAVLADAAARRRVRLVPAGLDALDLGARGPVGCRVAGRRREYDLVVLAAGPWSAALLARAGLPTGDLRTKSIQYGIHRVDGWCPPLFVDEPSGLYGRPAGDGALLLGLATDQWSVDPDRPPVTPALHDRAVRLARARFPALRLGPLTRVVGAVDCYGPHPTLSLRPVAGSGHRLFTFTGGAGGSVKTALAASRDAVTRLVDPGAPPLLPLGPREGLS